MQITLHKFGIKEETIAKGLEYLVAQQRSDRCFGSGTVEEASLAITAFMTCSFDAVDIDPVIQFLIDSQNPDGSFPRSYTGVYAHSIFYSDPIYSAYLGLNGYSYYTDKVQV